MGKKQDDLYQDEYEPAGLRWMSLAVVFLAVSGFIALAWYAYNAGQQDMRVEDVLIVRAEDKPYRVPPKEPGGAEFRHKDKSIYSNLDGTKAPAEKAEIVESEAPKRPKQVTKVAPAVQAKKEEVTSYVSPIPKPEEKKIAQPDPFAPPVKAAEKPAVKEAQKPAKADAKGHTVQLGAFRSNDEAEQTWQRIRRSHLDELDRAQYKIIRADLGAKGVYHRLRVIGLESKARADGLCKVLSGRGQGCFYSGKL